MKNIVNALKLERIKLGLSQKEVAEELGVCQPYLSQLENHKKPRFSTAILVRYASTLNVPIPVLMWRSLTEDDIPKGKVEVYRALKPSIDAMVSDIFDTKRE